MLWVWCVCYGLLWEKSELADAHQIKSKISQNGEELNELWSKQYWFVVLSVTHSMPHISMAHQHRHQPHILASATCNSIDHTTLDSSSLN
jgi:hypothetical protein